MATFLQDGYNGHCNNWVRIGLAFTQDWFHLELMHENCAGDNCIAGVQENNRRAEWKRGLVITSLLKKIATNFI